MDGLITHSLYLPFTKGNILWKLRKTWLPNSSSFKKGLVPWNKGIPRTEEEKLKMSISIKKGFQNGRPSPRGSLGISQSAESREKKRVDRIGIKNPNWRGGKSKFARNIRTCSKYNWWRESIFKRDNFICQLCQLSSSGHLNVDHFPVSFKQILDEFVKEHGEDFLKAMECEKLWNLNNGRTLCEKCHILVHFPKGDPNGTS